MANVTVCGYARTVTGQQIALRGDTLAEGTEHTIQTDTNLTTTAQDIGTYAPGATIVSLELFSPNGISFCYLLRQGLILAFGSPNVAGVSNHESKLCRPVTLRPGDQVRCLPLSSSARNAALCVYTATGVSRIFIGTPSGAATTNLLDLQDSNPIGETLSGQVITKAVFTSVDGSKIVSSGSAWIRNPSGVLSGAVPASNPTAVEPMITTTAIPIQLNSTATVVTSS